jgi:hypothetical protein
MWALFSTKPTLADLESRYTEMIGFTPSPRYFAAARLSISREKS